MEFKDLLGIGKGVGKLTEILEKAVGRISKSYFSKKDADAEAYRIKAVGQAHADNLKYLSQTIDSTSGTQEIGFSTDKGVDIKAIPKKEFFNILAANPNISERAISREEHQRLVRQSNLESVISTASEQLHSEHDVSEEKVDEDWVNRFFNIAEDVSNEEMQKLWGRILAGEIKRPKSFSLRTLELIKNLTADEAHIVSKMAHFCTVGIQAASIYQNNELLEQFGIPYYELMMLDEIGIIQSMQAALIYDDITPGEIVDLVFSGYRIKIDAKIPMKIFQMPCIPLTKSGYEILPLLDKSTPVDYIIKVAKELAKNKLVKVSCFDHNNQPVLYEG